jgi:hypothetical protein
VAVVTLQGLRVRKTAFGYVAFLAFCIGETAVSVAKTVWLVFGIMVRQWVQLFSHKIGRGENINNMPTSKLYSKFSLKARKLSV